MSDIKRDTTPTTYNPQERSFIEKPEAKLCPTCGNLMTPPVKPITNIMGTYVNAETGKTYATINSDAPELVIQGVKVVRKDLYKAVIAPVTPVPAPVTKPTTTTEPTK